MVLEVVVTARIKDIRKIVLPSLDLQNFPQVQISMQVKRKRHMSSRAGHRVPKRNLIKIIIFSSNCALLRGYR